MNGDDLLPQPQGGGAPPPLPPMGPSLLQQSRGPTPESTGLVQPTPPGMVSVDDFAKSVKEKYPEYGSVDNKQLTSAMLEKYPEYKDTVHVPTVGVAAPRPPDPGFLGQAWSNIKGLGHFAGYGIQALTGDPAGAISRAAMDRQAAGNLGDNADILATPLRELAGVPAKGESVMGPSFMDQKTGASRREPLLTRTANAMSATMGGNPASAREHFEHGETGAGVADLLAVPGATRAIMEPSTVTRPITVAGRVALKPASSLGELGITGRDVVHAAVSPKTFGIKMAGRAINRAMNGPDMTTSEGAGYGAAKGPKLGVNRKPVWQSTAPAIEVERRMGATDEGMRSLQNEDILSDKPAPREPQPVAEEPPTWPGGVPRNRGAEAEVESALGEATRPATVSGGSTGPNVNVDPVNTNDLIRERRATPRSTTTPPDPTLDYGRVQSLRRELATETDPDKIAEINYAIEREKSIISERTPTMTEKLRQIQVKPPEGGRIKPPRANAEPEPAITTATKPATAKTKTGTGTGFSLGKMKGYYAK